MKARRVEDRAWTHPGAFRRHVRRKYRPPLDKGGLQGGLETGTQPTRRVATTVAARHSSDGGTLNGVFHAALRATFDENVRAARVR
jgi:hypothetical protein